MTGFTLEFFLPALAMATLLVAVIAAMRGARRVEQRRRDETVPPSSLARDGDSRRKVD